MAAMKLEEATDPLAATVVASIVIASIAKITVAVEPQGYRLVIPSAVLIATLAHVTIAKFARRG